MSVSEIVFLTMFTLLTFGIPSAVVWASYSERGALKDFDIRDLWMHQGRIDKLAVIILGSWWAHTSAMVLETLLRTVETQDWVTYQLWAIPLIAKIYAPTKEGSP
jgi:hypothetical protein